MSSASYLELDDNNKGGTMLQQQQPEETTQVTTVAQAESVDASSALSPLAASKVTALAIPDEARKQLALKADGYIAELKRDPSGSTNLIESLVNIGSESQYSSSRLLESKASELTYDPAKRNGAVANNLVQLRVELDRVNPAALESGTFYRICSAICPPIANAIRNGFVTKIVAGGESVKKNIDVVCGNLEAGRAKILDDNASLAALKGQLLEGRKKLELNVALLEYLVEGAKNEVAMAQDATNKQYWVQIQARLTKRLQDFEAIKVIFEQFVITIEMTITNNSNLAGEVRNLVTLGKPALYAALSIELSLRNQRAVMNATKTTSEYLGRTINSNADKLGQATEDMATMMTTPVVAMEQIRSAHAKMLSAIDSSQKMWDQVITVANQNIPELRKMSQELVQKSGNKELQGEKPEQPKAIEAATLLS